MLQQPWLLKYLQGLTRKDCQLIAANKTTAAARTRANYGMPRSSFRDIVFYIYIAKHGERLYYTMGVILVEEREKSEKKKGACFVSKDIGLPCIISFKYITLEPKPIIEMHLIGI